VCREANFDTKINSKNSTIKSRNLEYHLLSQKLAQNLLLKQKQEHRNIESEPHTPCGGYVDRACCVVLASSKSFAAGKTRINLGRTSRPSRYSDMQLVK